MFYYANTFYHGQRNIGTRTRVYFISLSFFLSLSLSLQHIINGSRDVALNNYRYLKRKKKVMQAELILLTVAIEEATSRRLIKGSHKRVCIQVHIYVNIYNYIYTIYVFVVCDYVWRNLFSNLFELRRSLIISRAFSSEIL